MLGDHEVELWEGKPPQHWARVWRIPELHILDRTTSTNTVARHLADHGAPAGTAVLAEEQTAGRGRLGRSWSAPRGRALLVSVILRPPAGLRSIRIPTAIPIRVGIAAARAIEAVARTRTGLKWPNDVVIPGSGKVAGILCEGALGDRVAEYVIAGVGINVNQAEHDFPPDLRGRATSLAIVAGHGVSRAELAGVLLREIAAIRDPGEPLDEPTLAEYSRRDVLAGQPVLVDDADAGTAAGVTADGALVTIRDGVRCVIRGGTVRVREAGGVPGRRAVGYPPGAGSPYRAARDRLA
jgi:BirA family biotin operon repressor/biotin-[acetyl-CoA-carboxylase] ligase